MLDMLFTTDAMRAVFSDGARVQRMLEFEAALARAEAASGVIPQAAAAAIAASAMPAYSIRRRCRRPRATPATARSRW